MQTGHGWSSEGLNSSLLAPEVGPQVLNSACVHTVLCAWCPARWEAGLGCGTGPRWEASLASARLSCGNLCRVAQTVFPKQERAWKGRCLDGSARETSLYLSVWMVLPELLESHFRCDWAHLVLSLTECRQLLMQCGVNGHDCWVVQRFVQLWTLGWCYGLSVVGVNGNTGL